MTAFWHLARRRAKARLIQLRAEQADGDDSATLAARVAWWEQYLERLELNRP